MNAEALTAPPVPVEYDPDVDPALDTRPSIRIRLRKAGVARPEPGKELKPEDVLHDRRYYPVERTAHLGERAKATEARLKALPDEDIDAAVALLAEMVEMLLEDGAGLKQVLTDAWQHDAVSVEYLTRTIAWIQRQQEGRSEAGEASRQS